MDIKDPKKEQGRYLKIGFAVYLAIVYLTLQFSKVEDFTIDKLNLVTEQIAKHPFDIFPIDGKAFFIGSYIGLMAFALIWVEYLRRKRVVTKNEQGSAEWNTDLQAFYKKYSDYIKTGPYLKGKNIVIKVYNSIVDIFFKKIKVNMNPGNKNAILSSQVFLSMDGRKTKRNLNILVCGGSGSGKSRFMVKPNLLQANASYVITDPKGELLESTGTFLKKQGYKIKVFNLTDFENSSHYNPFQYVRDPEGVMMMINTLVKNTNDGKQGGDPFWEKAEVALLQAICFYLYYECDMPDRNFSNIMKLLRCAEVKEDQEDYVSTLDVMMQQVEERNPSHIAVLQYKVFKQAAGKTAKSILITAQTRLANFNIPTIANLTNNDNLELTKIGDEKTALFVIIKDSDDTFNFLVALMYSQLFESLYYHADNECEGKRLKHHVRFMLDEFANIGTIPDFEKKLATMRSREISCTIIIQNLAQLKTMYKDTWESITGNCDTFIFLGGKEQATLKYVSEELGKKTIVTQTDSRSFGKGGGSSRNKNIIGRELMTAQEISQMDTMDSIVMLRGERPFFTRKYEYTEHPNYHLTGDANDKYKYDLEKEFAKNEPKKSARLEALKRRGKRRTQRPTRAERPQTVKTAKGVEKHKIAELDDESMKQMLSVKKDKDLNEKDVSEHLILEDIHLPEKNLLSKEEPKSSIAKNKKEDLEVKKEELKENKEVVQKVEETMVELEKFEEDTGEDFLYQSLAGEEDSLLDDYYND